MADEVPPLEDVPGVLEKIQKAEDQQKMTKESAKMPNSVHEEGAKIASQEKGALEAEGVKKSDVGGQKVQRQRESTGFGGLKKGFLSGGSAKVSQRCCKVPEKIQRVEDQPKMTKESAKMPNSVHEEGAKIASQEKGALEAEGVKKSDVGGQKVQQQRESTGFGGLKKGFLFGGGAKQSKPKKEEVKAASDLPLIRAQPEKSSLVIKEVQEAMDANHAMEFQDQLAKRLEANPKVADVITDPVWIPILDELRRDPEGTLAKYRHDPAIMHTLKELCNVLGDTFLNMDNKGKEGGDLVSSSYAEAPGVPEALADPLVKQLMKHMRAGDNQEIQRCVRSANPSQKKRIQTLVDVGLFKFTMEI